MICRAKQWTGFYMIGASVIKELNHGTKIQISSYYSSMVILAVSFSELHQGFYGCIKRKLKRLDSIIALDD